ncbi:MAG TPA: dephospho-CoA kinase [Phycisphaerae bacterium]|nr:dephospho-CoA kinase [Phycisphaerae bacterium]HRY69304.1 dephospho-CoA kinase [Phycisphaerae bacterium]HSA26622.1 dephospho-CoA kinase [Phycisphaerae bacterium]
MTRAGKPIIGIAGGIGSGKSTVAAILQDLGARVIDADRINHEELDSPEVLEALVGWWGEEVVSPGPRANRSAIREIVRESPAELGRLERLVHPRIARRSEELLAAYDRDPRVRAIVWDAPLLYEVGLAERCDCVVFVNADEQTRLRRVRRSRGWDLRDLARMQASQKPLDFKRNRADYTVENNSDIDDLRRQVEEVFSRILSGCQDASGR